MRRFFIHRLCRKTLYIGISNPFSQLFFWIDWWWKLIHVTFDLHFSVINFFFLNWMENVDSTVGNRKLPEKVTLVLPYLFFPSTCHVKAKNGEYNKECLNTLARNLFFSITHVLAFKKKCSVPVMGLHFFSWIFLTRRYRRSDHFGILEWESWVFPFMFCWIMFAMTIF